MISITNKKKYELIADKLEEMILSNNMKKEQRLASVNDLCKMFNVAPVTMCNSLELLRDRGLIRSVPRKGNFVKNIPQNKNLHSRETFNYIERCSPVSSIFTPRLKTLSIFLEDYDIPSRKSFWDCVIAEFQIQYPKINIVASADKKKSTKCDVILNSGNDQSQLSCTAEVRKKLFDQINIKDYFPASLSADKQQKHAALPFSISQEMRLWNGELAKKYCPGVIENNPSNVISYIIDNYDYKAPDFPLVASFIHFVPLILISEGIDVYNSTNGILDFSDKRIPEILEFNRCMIEKLYKMTDWDGEFNPEFFWNAFSRGEILALDTFSYALMIIPENTSFEIFAQTSDMERFNCSTSVQSIMGVGKDCEDIDSAINFIKFACGECGQQMLADSKSNIPAMRSVAESEQFLKHCPTNMDSLLQKLYHNDSVLTMMEIFDQNKYFNLEIVFQNYLYGKIELSEAIEQLKQVASAKQNNK